MHVKVLTIFITQTHTSTHNTHNSFKQKKTENQNINETMKVMN